MFILTLSLLVANPIISAAQSSPRPTSTVSAIMAGSIPTGSDLLRMTSEGRHTVVVDIAPARIAQVPDDMDAYASLAWSLNALGRYAEALQWANKGFSLQKDPRLAEAIGEASYYQGNNDLALSKLQEYIASAPEGARAGLSFYLCGELFLRKAQYNHADIAFTSALQYNPNNPAWWTRLGWARENAKNYLQALSAYEKALSLNPAFPDAKDGRKRILDRMR
jgi:tetratricopeptide (TPR) repeat protein